MIIVKRIKKLSLLLGVMVIVMLAVMHYRVPILIKECRGPWSIGILKDSSGISLRTTISYDSINSVTNNTLFVADVFAVDVDSVVYLFFEHSEKKNKYGGAQIAVLELDKQLNWKYLGNVLEEKFHLSYPQVFKHEDDWYMIPESQGAGNVRLYTSTKFPMQWQLEKVIIPDIKLKDPTLLRKNGVFYIIGADADFVGHVFMSKSLFGPYHEHPKSPYHVGNKTRNGGPIFYENNRWYMPVQDLANGYGWGVYLRPITQIDEERIEFGSDSLVLKPINSQYFNGGMHHYDKTIASSRNIVIVDGNTCKEQKWIWRFKYSLKFNLLDIKNWFGNYGRI